MHKVVILLLFLIYVYIRNIKYVIIKHKDGDKMSKENKIIFLVIFVIGITTIFYMLISQKKTAYNDAIEIADNVLNNKGYTLLYVGAGNCDGCKLEEAQIKPLIENYDFGFFYINLEDLSKNNVSDLIMKLKFGTGLFTVPTLLVYKDGEFIDSLSGLSNIESIFSFLKKYSIISEESELLMNYIDLEEYTKLISSKKTQIIALGSIISEKSNEAQQALWNVVSETGININYLSIENFKDEELDTLYKSLNYFEENETDIPMIFVVKNKQVLDSSLEILDKEGYIEFFKNNDLM